MVITYSIISKIEIFRTKIGFFIVSTHTEFVSENNDKFVFPNRITNFLNVVLLAMVKRKIEKGHFKINWLVPLDGEKHIFRPFLKK